MLKPPELYMERCLQLALLGSGKVAPNPMVGAVLVHNDRIIGEGWHNEFGKAHAEVACIASVKAEDKLLISQASLFVSLEPCNHYGKTPPCTELIIANKIPKVFIGCRDPFEKVNGSGIKRLEEAGVIVRDGILESKAKDLNKRFFTVQEKHRPFIILKWAETADGFMAPEINIKHLTPLNDNPRLLISGEEANRLVHKWRTEEASIMIGAGTAAADNPSLTARLWPGKSPLRLVLDTDLELSNTLNLFNDGGPTVIFNKHSNKQVGAVEYCKINNSTRSLEEVLKILQQKQIQSVFVEGGAGLLNSFLREGIWDEIRVIRSKKLKIEKGLPAPSVPKADLIEEIDLSEDAIYIYRRS